MKTPTKVKEMRLAQSQSSIERRSGSRFFPRSAQESAAFECAQDVGPTSLSHALQALAHATDGYVTALDLYDPQVLYGERKARTAENPVWRKLVGGLNAPGAEMSQHVG
jgi:hypothetical protein